MPISLVDLLMISPPIQWSAADDTAPPPPTEDFFTALRAYMLDLPGLATLKGVYLSSSPAGAAFPYMVINRLYQRAIVITSDAYYKELALQFTVLTQDGGEADTLGYAAYSALYPLRDWEAIRFAEGYEMLREPGQARGPDRQDAGAVGGDPVWQFSFDYTWSIGVN